MLLKHRRVFTLGGSPEASGDSVHPSSSSILSDWPSKPPVEVCRGADLSRGQALRPHLARGRGRGRGRDSRPESSSLPARDPAARSPQLGGSGGGLGVRPSPPPAQPSTGASSGRPLRAPAPAAPPRRPQRHPERAPGSQPDLSPHPSRARPAPRAPRCPSAPRARGRPGRRRRRSPGHVPAAGRAARERGRGRWSAGASSFGAAAAAAVSGLAGLTSPPQVCERPRRGGSSSSSGPGEGQARNRYKRKRRRGGRGNAVYLREAEPPAPHKRRTPATRLPPRPVPAASGPASACAAPRDRPAPAPTPKPCGGPRGRGDPVPIGPRAPGTGAVFPGSGDLGQVTAGEPAAAWAPARTRVPRPSGQQVPVPGSGPLTCTLAMMAILAAGSGRACASRTFIPLGRGPTKCRLCHSPCPGRGGAGGAHLRVCSWCLVL